MGRYDGTFRGNSGNNSFKAYKKSFSRLGLIKRWGSWTMFGYAGNDRLTGGAKNDKIYGGSGNDYLRGESGNDYLSGGSGNDNLSGGSGRDTLSGGSGRDYLFGGSGNDSLRGGSGNDYLSGESGNDYAFGGSGNDTLLGGTGSDQLVGGSGYDTLNAYGGKVGEYDTLSGDFSSSKPREYKFGDRADKFILGDSRQVFYKGNGYATITDFNRSEGDKIQLHGSRNDYSLGFSRSSKGTSALDTFIYYKGNTVGIVQDTTSVSLYSDVQFV